MVTSFVDATAQLSNWEFTFYGLLFIFSLTMGIIFAFLDRNLKSFMKSEVDDVLEDMQCIEKIFSESQ